LSVFEVGRVCLKTSGRDAGKKCVVIDLLDKNFVVVTGPKDKTGVRRKRVNMNHLKPLEEKLNINKNASDEEISKIIK
jgi:large subunit ribosomal protein L14e